MVRKGVFLVSVFLLGWQLLSGESLRSSVDDIQLTKLAKPGNPFCESGRRFAFLGEESGSFEAWAYPLKLVRDFKFYLFTGNSVRPIPAEKITEKISKKPGVTTITYVYQNFTIEANYISSVEEPAGLILLKVDSDVPLKIVCSFLPVLQPMWPAGLGGQYSYWHDGMKAYIISESTGKNHAIVGSPVGKGISYTPAHMLSDAASEFVIEVSDPADVKDKFIPIVIVGGKRNFSKYKEIYENVLADPKKVYHETSEHFKELLRNTLRVYTPDDSLNLAFEWAKIAYDNLFVDNPDLGKGLIAGLGRSGSSGRPGFGWFFGGDAYINILSLNCFNYYSVVKDALKFTQKWQRKDGKMAHELTQAAGYVDWWNDYHYGYIHGDTTPYYIIALYDYVRWSGDVDFARESWGSIKKAYKWCKSTDSNNDGLMDNRKAGLGATEYGEFTGVVTDIYLGAVWVKAIYSMRELAKIVGDKKYVKITTNDFERANASLRRKFWNEEEGFIAFAFNDNGEKVKELTPWGAVGLSWKLFPPEKGIETLSKINSASLMTDWGVRTVSKESKFYSPLNYNYGAVWPFITSWVTTAQFKYGNSLQGYSSLKATADLTFVHELGAITEVFSGSRCIWPQEAVSHQGFSSAGVILPFVSGLLGVSGNALKRELTFSPQLPPDWDTLHVENLRIGKSRWTLDFSKNCNKIVVKVSGENCDGYNVVVSPGLFATWVVKKVFVNGNEVEYNCKKTEYLVFPEVQFNSSGEDIVSIEYEPSFTILPPARSPEVGYEAKGLRITSLKYNEGNIDLVVEGRTGNSYVLGLLYPEHIKSIEGAKVINGKLKIDFPQANSDFTRKVIKIEVE